MRKSVISIIALATLCFVAGDAWAKTIMTEQQVRNVCGSGLKSGGTATQSAIGCEKSCGKKTCMYGCTTDKKSGKQTCEGSVLFVANPGAAKTGAVPPSGGILGSDPSLPGQGPSRTGTGSGKPGGTIY